MDPLPVGQPAGKATMITHLSARPLSSIWPIRRTHRLDGRVAVQQAVPARPVTCRARGAMVAGQPCTQNSMICERLDAVAKLISCVRNRQGSVIAFAVCKLSACHVMWLARPGAGPAVRRGCGYPRTRG